MDSSWLDWGQEKERCGLTFRFLIVYLGGLWSCSHDSSILGLLCWRYLTHVFCLFVCLPCTKVVIKELEHKPVYESFRAWDEVKLEMSDWRECRTWIRTRVRKVFAIHYKKFASFFLSMYLLRAVFQELWTWSWNTQLSMSPESSAEVSHVMLHGWVTDKLSRSPAALRAAQASPSPYTGVVCMCFIACMSSLRDCRAH